MRKTIDKEELESLIEYLWKESLEIVNNKNLYVEGYHDCMRHIIENLQLKGDTIK